VARATPDRLFLTFHRGVRAGLVQAPASHPDTGRSSCGRGDWLNIEFTPTPRCSRSSATQVGQTACCWRSSAARADGIALAGELFASSATASASLRRADGWPAILARSTRLSHMPKHIHRTPSGRDATAFANQYHRPVRHTGSLPAT